MPDIDIDFADRNHVLKTIKHIPAIISQGKKHNTGIYVTDIPNNPVNNFSTIPYKEAEERGYFKLDFLNVTFYKDIRNEHHLQQLMNREPLWELFEHKEFVDQVFHLSGHSHICKKLKPKNISQLAAVLAIIRPAKRYLLNKNWIDIEREVWLKPTDGSYFFKKAHAFSYAVAAIVHANLLCEQITS
tara:strand:+ start:4075 stop:4635 length:561 start_codon:yes stop_codon:yes gene_type:complete